MQALAGLQDRRSVWNLGLKLVSGAGLSYTQPGRYHGITADQQYFCGHSRSQRRVFSCGADYCSFSDSLSGSYFRNFSAYSGLEQLCSQSFLTRKRMGRQRSNRSSSLIILHFLYIKKILYYMFMLESVCAGKSFGQLNQKYRVKFPPLVSHHHSLHIKKLSNSELFK